MIAIYVLLGLIVVLLAFRQLDEMRYRAKWDKPKDPEKEAEEEKSRLTRFTEQLAPYVRQILYPQEMVKGELGPDEEFSMTVCPVVPIRATSFFVSDGCADDFQILQIRLGKEEWIYGESGVPASMFKSDAVRPPFCSVDLAASVPIVVTVKNVSPRWRRFTGAIWGQETLGTPSPGETVPQIPIGFDSADHQNK